MSNRLIKLYKCDICGEEQEEEMMCVAMSEGTFDLCSYDCEEELYREIKNQEVKK